MLYCKISTGDGNPLPTLTVVNPAAVCSSTVDITSNTVQTTNTGTTTKYYTIYFAKPRCSIRYNNTSGCRNNWQPIRSEFATDALL
jgi:hypothetical protein